MADLQISGLPNVGRPLAATDQFAIDDASNVTWNITGTQLIEGTGAVIGPSSATDTAIALFDGTTGKLIKNSLVTINSSGNMLFPSGANINMPGASFINANSFNGTTVQFTGASSFNSIVLQAGQASALTMTDGSALNDYLTINSTVNRPRMILGNESLITAPLTMNGGYVVNWPGGVYNSSGALSASQSGTTVTGSGTNFPAECVGGQIYWPSTGNIAVITARVSGTSLTVDFSQSQANAPFMIYYGGLNIDYAGVRQLQGQTLQTNSIDTPDSSIGQGTTLAIGGTKATSILLGATSYPLSTTINQILYSSSANTVTGLATANNGVLITSGAGAPSISTTLPSGIAATNMNLTTPTLGVATATSINGNTITTGSSTTLTIASTSNNITSPTRTSWSPVMKDSAGNQFTMTAQNGQYIIYGNVYFIWIDIAWSSKGSAVSTNTLQISLPITIASQPDRPVFALAGINGITATQLTAGGSSGNNFINLYNYTGTSTSTLTVASAAASGFLQLSGFIGA